MIEQARGLRLGGFVRSRLARLEETNRDAGSDTRDRHVQAPSRTVQSDIAAIGLPEGPGLAFKLPWVLSQLRSTNSAISSGWLSMAAAQPTPASTSGNTA
jgi:hypothetical protein